jgi:hypothetical protein
MRIPSTDRTNNADARGRLTAPRAVYLCTLSASRIESARAASCANLYSVYNSMIQKDYFFSVKKWSI